MKQILATIITIIADHMQYWAVKLRALAWDLGERSCLICGQPSQKAECQDCSPGLGTLLARHHLRGAGIGVSNQHQ